MVNRAIDTALEDESHAVVNQALLSIAKNGQRVSMKTLRAMLDDGNLNKSYVIRALGVSLDPVSVAMLEKAFIINIPEEKYAVLEAMSCSTHKDASQAPCNGIHGRQHRNRSKGALLAHAQTLEYRDLFVAG